MSLLRALFSARDDRVFCEKCHARLGTGDRYCSDCGAPITLPATALAHPTADRATLFWGKFETGFRQLLNFAAIVTRSFLQRLVSVSLAAGTRMLSFLRQAASISQSELARIGKELRSVQLPRWPKIHQAPSIPNSLERPVLGQEHQPAIPDVLQDIPPGPNPGDQPRKEDRRQEPVTTEKGTSVLSPPGSEAWERSMSLGKTALRQNRLSEAEQAFLGAMKECESSDLSSGLTLRELALVYTEQKNFSKAEQFCNRALGILGKVCPPEDPDVGDAMETAARIQQFQRNYAEAERLFRQALAIFEKSGGSENIRTAEVLRGLAFNYMSQRKYAEAKPVFEKSLEILAEIPTVPKPAVQIAIRDLKTVYQILKRRDKAELLDRRFANLIHL